MARATRDETAGEVRSQQFPNETEKELKGFTEVEAGKPKTAATLFFPWFLYFSLTSFLIFFVATFFQMQLVALKQELATLKFNFSGREEERPRNLKKRSSTEFEENEAKQDTGIEGAYLQGAFPFQHIQKQGKIGPWLASSTDDSFIALKEKNTEIEISQSGLYYVYAQVYYLTSQPHNSFQILLYNGTEERKYHKDVATCSSQGRSSVGEASCYTGFIGSFHSATVALILGLFYSRKTRPLNGKHDCKNRPEPGFTSNLKVQLDSIGFC